MEDKEYEDAFFSLGKNKRKSDKLLECFASITKRLESFKKCSDIIALLLHWKTTEKELREYLEQYGRVSMAQVKKDLKTGQGKDFSSIHFTNYEVQQRVLCLRRVIGRRVCDVKIKKSKEITTQQVMHEAFIGLCTEDIRAGNIKGYFGGYGGIADVFTPKPFRAFALVIFLNPIVAQSLCSEDYIAKGTSIHVLNAASINDFIRRPLGRSRIDGSRRR